MQEEDDGVINNFSIVAVPGIDFVENYEDKAIKGMVRATVVENSDPVVNAVVVSSVGEKEEQRCEIVRLGTQDHFVLVSVSSQGAEHA